MTASPEPVQSVRDSRYLLNVPRALGRSHRLTQAELYRATEYEGKSPFARAADYLQIEVFLWAWHYLKSRLGGRYPFAEYGLGSHDRGIYDLASAPGSSEPVKVSLVGDWGTGTQEASDIAALVKRGVPHCTVHLGDVYYVGTKKEVLENMFERVTWPIGTRGSFALNSNHEMYARGKGYFKYLLPRLGYRDRNDAPLPGQGASFFCLKNDHWLVIGLDTGYNSVGWPLVEFLFKPSCKLPTPLLAWLRNDVRLHEDRTRGIVLLSHHQYYSQFEDRYERPAQQLSELLTRPVLWFWGHEHRLAIYGKHATQKGKLEAYGRCIGHGGMPIEDINKTPQTDAKHQVKLVFYDQRVKRHLGVNRVAVGFNGFTDLVFAGNTLTITYRDVDAQVLIEEGWEVDAHGMLHGRSIQQHTTHADLKVHSGNLHHAVQ